MESVVHSAAKMNGDSNEVEQFTPNLITLQMTGFIVPGKRLNNYFAFFINVVLYPLTILLIVLELFCNQFTLRTSVEFLYITSSTCISFGRRIFFWMHGNRLRKLLQCFKSKQRNLLCTLLMEKTVIFVNAKVKLIFYIYMI